MRGFVYRCPCCWLCRTYLEFNLSYDCADPLVVLTLHMMLLLFCLGWLNHFIPLTPPPTDTLTMYVCLSLSLLRCLFASFDGRWTDTELAYMKLSSSLAIYQFSLPALPLFNSLLPPLLPLCLSLSQCPVGLPVWLADTLDSTHMSGRSWLCSAIFRSFLLYFILFYFLFGSFFFWFANQNCV